MYMYIKYIKVKWYDMYPMYIYLLFNDMYIKNDIDISIIKSD